MTEDMRVDSGEPATPPTAGVPSNTPPSDDAPSDDAPSDNAPSTTAQSTTAQSDNPQSDDPQSDDAEATIVENGSDSAQSAAPAASDAADFEAAQELAEQAPSDTTDQDVVAAPATDQDVVAAPATDEPDHAAAASDTSPIETRVAGTPMTETPVTETPVNETPVNETPVTETPEPTGDRPVVEPAADVPATPAASPRPNPGRGPGGRPGRPSGAPAVVPGGRTATARRSGAPAPLAVEATVEATDPHKWGRIDETGVVYVFASLGERAVGNWQAGDAEAGLAHFARRFDDFATEIALLETRLATGSGDPKATKAHAIELRESVDTLAGIGDLDSAAARLEIVIGAADAAIAGASTARAAARAAAVAAKEALCAEAETLAESEQWKATGDRLKEIVEEWRTIKGIDRKTDDALWKRFAKARDAFTRHRGTHFADLDKQRGAAKEAKEALIARAEALAESTEWGRTAGEYRTLMEEWKASGRAPRDVEDALWDRFRAAQEKFFSHRHQTFSERDQEFETNAAIKEKLLAEAELINPSGGLDAAKAALRSIQERWEAAGKVPRERIKEFDSRLRAVEDRIRSAEDSHWRRTDPETTARIEQFRSRAATYRAQADKARASGNERKAKEAESQAKQWEEWLAAAESVVDR